MEEKDILKNEYMRIFRSENDVFIETYEKGFPVDKINEVLKSNPQIAITSFSTFRNAVMLAPKEAVKFGEFREGIEVFILHGEMKANVRYNLSVEQLLPENRETLIKQTFLLLSKYEIVFGIKNELFSQELVPGKEYTIAEGILPVHGNDSIIKMYELEEAKPEVSDDGKVDFYELQLINRVKTGDWLGERIEATEGIPGKTIRGNEIPPVKGRKFPLLYDRKTVQEIYDNNKTVLFSRINGAVCYTNGQISVSNHLEIKGDVDLSTGNIKFDGYVTIKGTVLDGFSVEATKDIEINSDIGLGNIKYINSTEGSVFIKGGIASKGNSEIKAAKNIYMKFVDNTSVTCGGTAHIGYYSISSTINAQRIIFDSSSAQQMGGHSKAKYMISLPILGSVIEKITSVEVTGFDRQALENEIEEIIQQTEDLKNKQKSINQKILTYDTLQNPDPFQKKEYGRLLENAFNIRNDIKLLEEKRKEYKNYLKTKGEGEIAITKRFYPKTTIILSGTVAEPREDGLASTFYLQEGQIKQI
jgi:uncharacterized protein